MSPSSLKARRLHNSRRELVAACEATSTTGLISFRAFVQALHGLDPCRIGRKRCRKHCLQQLHTHQTRHARTTTLAPGAVFFSFLFFPGVSRPTKFYIGAFRRLAPPPPHYYRGVGHIQSRGIGVARLLVTASSCVPMHYRTNSVS